MNELMAGNPEAIHATHTGLRSLTLHANNINQAAGIEKFQQINWGRHPWRHAHGKARRIGDASNKRPSVRKEKPMGFNTTF